MHNSAWYAVPASTSCPEPSPECVAGEAGRQGEQAGAPLLALHGSSSVGGLNSQQQLPLGQASSCSLLLPCSSVGGEEGASPMALLHKGKSMGVSFPLPLQEAEGAGDEDASHRGSMAGQGGRI